MNRRSLKFFYVFLLLFLFIGSVNAKDIFKYDWETPEHTSTVSYYTKGYTYPNNFMIQYEFSYMLYTNYQEYMDGYVTTEEIFDETESEWTTLVSYYDKDGNVIKQNSDYDFTIDDMIVINNRIYVVAYDSSATINRYTVKMLNEELEVEKSSIINYYNKNWDTYTRKYYGIDFMSVDSSNLIVYSGYNVYVIDLDLSAESYSSSTSYNLLSLETNRYNVLMRLFGNYKGGMTAYVSANNMGNNETILSGAYYEEECTMNVDTCVTSYIISSFDSENNMLWSLENEKYLGITDVSYVDGYLVGLANKYDENHNIINIILVLDKEGNVLQEIEKEENLMMLKPMSDGFMVLTYHDKDEDDLSKYNVEKYVYSYDIKTKTDGNGIINVNKSAKEGELVEFTVSPNANYSLKKVIVTDVNGKTIEVKESSFVMPNSDVIIEAEFEVKNPETSIQSTLILGVMSIAFMVFFIYNYKKLKWLH